MEKKQRIEKAKTQEKLKQTMSAAKSVVFVDYRGVNVADDTRLRRLCREAQVNYSVVKNTLTLRAANELGWSGLEHILQGPTGMAVSDVDPVAPAKVLNTFAREVPSLKIKGGVLDGEIVPPEKVAYLATLPSKDELLAQVAGAFKSPLFGVVTVLNATLSGFVRALDAIREKKAAEAQ